MIKNTAIYFIGIGGIGMSALARYYKTQGYVVLGSDSARSIIIDSLKKDAINVKIGQKTGSIKPGMDLVIYNRAIASDNPELRAARRRGLRTIPYAEALGELTEQYTTIAITGSHGKSTTTALAALTLIRGGLDPTVLVGTNLREFGGKNIRLGKRGGAKNSEAKPPYLVLEADDFGGAFWSYSPTILIVTNIDREHLDFYKNLGGVKKAFLKFIETARPGGTLILNRDDKNLYSLKSPINMIAKKKKLQTVWYSVHSEHVSNGALCSAATKIKKVLKIPGEHNLSNAMAVYELGKMLKINEKNMLDALGAYRGAWRRMEYRGEWKMKDHGRNGTLKIFDDYAHHPTEIKATLQGFREKFPHSPLVCVFQPHQTKRLKMLFDEFVGAFTDADILVLVPTYSVAGRDVADQKFTSERLAAAIQKKYPKKKVFYLAHPKRIKTYLRNLPIPISSSPILVMMGAGDIVRSTDTLIR